MADKRLNRRHILKGAGALGAVGALAALRAPTPTQAAGWDAIDEDNRDLEGSWLFTVTQTAGPNAGHPFLAMLTFAAGGGLVETDTAGAGPGGGTTGPGHGAWMRTAEKQYTCRFLKFVTSTAGAFAGTLVIAGQLTLTEARKLADDTLSGTATASGFDVTGKPLFPPTPETFTATRISV